jgi:hypothetical protein
MHRKWLLAVPFLWALFWGSCRDTTPQHSLPLPSGTELDWRFAICAWSSSMIALIITGVVVRETGRKKD